jgi:multicomponent Na+:H+ antiporter subunit G
MSLIDLVTVALIAASAAFFAGATLGILRFPDTFSRLHAVTKADNLGLGFLVAALALQSGSFLVAAKLALIWVIAMVAGSAASYLVARHAYMRERGEEPEA